MRFAPVLLLALAACEPSQGPDNPEMEAPSGADVAAEIAWERLGGKGNLPEIHYVSGLVYGTDWGSTVGGVIYLQLDACPREIDRICRPSQTSLTHELLHVILDGDPEHRSAEWKKIDQIKADLYDMGL